MFKTNGLETDKSAAVQQAADRDAVKSAPTPVSCIGSAMKIVGNVECCGPAQVFGTIEGELRATELIIGEGGQVEGCIQAKDVTVNGRVKDTIRASRVRLQGATVEGDIIHRTLSIDESSVFNGMSRRLENPVERRADDTADSPSNAADGAAPKKVIPSPPLVPSTVSMANGRLQPN